MIQKNIFKKKIIRITLTICLLFLGFLVAGISLFCKDSNKWEKEFYSCADAYKNQILHMHDDDMSSSEYDLYVKKEKTENYLSSWNHYMEFVETWVGYSKDNQERESTYKNATILMILIYELHDEYHGFEDMNKYHYEFAYNHKNSQAEMLEEVSVALKVNNPIDEGMNSLRMIIPTLSGVGKIEDYVYMLEASAWKNEYYNCVTIAELVMQDENEALKIFSNFICQWGENNAQYARIDAGSGLSAFVAQAETEVYRTATLLIVNEIEKYDVEYEYVYDFEKDQESFDCYINNVAANEKGK